MKQVALLLVLLLAASAHISLHHPSVYDPEPYNDNYKDSNKASDPLDALPFDKWWWHGHLNNPPIARPDNVFELPANGQVKAWITTSRSFTPYGWPERMFPNPEAIVEPFADSPYVKWNNIHTNNRSDVAGCVLGISYKSDRFQIKPEDFVIFSVAHDCPARWLQTFQVPNLPACPNGMCQCAWFWVHKSYGGTDQIYMTPFQCKVTGASASASPVDVAHAKPPRKCFDPANCRLGPRNPMYWMNQDRNNMPEVMHFAPTYSTLYGFPEGAQQDIFVATNPVNYVSRPFPAEAKCGTKPSRLVSSGNGTLTLGQNDILVSPNCKYNLWFGGDGALYLGTPDRNSIWDTNFYWRTNGNPGGSGWTASITSAGDFIIQNSAGQNRFTSPMTSNVGVGPYRLELTNNGQLVLFDSLGHDLWESSWNDDREQKWVTPFNPDPAIWKTFSRNNTNNGGNNGGNGGDNSDYGPITANTDRWGSDIGNAKADSAKTCQAMCYKNAACVSFSWNSCGDGTCYMKGSAPSANANNCFASGTINGRTGNSNNNGGSFGPILTGDRPGSDLELVNAANIQDCQQKCLARQGCGSFAWDSCGNTLCWLKSGQPSVDATVGCRQNGVVNK